MRSGPAVVKNYLLDHLKWYMGIVVMQEIQEVGILDYFCIHKFWGDYHPHIEEFHLMYVSGHW